MTNEEIQQKAFEKVCRHERSKHRKCERSQRDGYDMVSRNSRGVVVRHIEVKGSTKRTVPFRWLEEREYTTLKRDRRFYLYVVTGVGTRSMRVHEFTQRNTLDHFRRKETKYLFTFAKKEFQ